MTDDPLAEMMPTDYWLECFNPTTKEIAGFHPKGYASSCDPNLEHRQIPLFSKPAVRKTMREWVKDIAHGIRYMKITAGDAADYLDKEADRLLM